MGMEKPSSLLNIPLYPVRTPVPPTTLGPDYTYEIQPYEAKDYCRTLSHFQISVVTLQQLVPPKNNYLTMGRRLNNRRCTEYRMGYHTRAVATLCTSLSTFLAMSTDSNEEDDDGGRGSESNIKTPSSFIYKRTTQTNTL